MGGGGKGGGGGSSEITVTSTSTSSMDSNTTVDILGLDNMNTRTELVLPQPFRTDSRTELVLPQPFRTESTSRSELAITEPIVSESTNRMLLDIRPLQVDTCIQFSMGPIPPMCVRQPYHHHFGITLFGMEIFGFTFSGESQVIIEEPAPRPQVMWGGEQAVERPHRPRAGPSGPPPSGPAQESAGGLRIRLT